MNIERLRAMPAAAIRWLGDAFASRGLPWPGSPWTASFQRKLQATLVAIFLLGGSVAGLAYWKSTQAAYLLERSRLAHEVLQSYLKLSSATYELYKVLGLRVLASERGVPFTSALSTESELIVRIEGKVKSLRRLIAEEIALVGGDPGEDAKEELQRLVGIEQRVTVLVREYSKLRGQEEGWDTLETWRRLAAVLDETVDKDFRRLIKGGIEDEATEVEETDLKAKALIRAMQWYIAIATTLGLITSILGASLLVHTVRRSLAVLRDGMDQFSAGNFSSRVAVVNDDEFGLLARQFNAMAAELEARRNAVEADRSSLERKVRERTSSLNELNSSLAAADQARRRFLADLSHELRTPLTIIRGESEIMLRGNGRDVDEYRDSLAKILEQSKHTTALVDDLLFIARRESGEGRLRLQPVDVARLLKKICEESRTLGSEKSIEVTCQIASVGSASIITGDATKLRQLFMILVDNAIRYSVKNGQITVSLMSATDGIVIVVADTGVGIPADDLPFIFERFYRGSNAGAQHTEGVGLGMPVAKAIVEAHSGSISVDSEQDRGTRVTVTLPGATRLKAIA